MMITIDISHHSKGPEISASSLEHIVLCVSTFTSVDVFAAQAHPGMDVEVRGQPSRLFKAGSLVSS